MVVDEVLAIELKAATTLHQSAPRQLYNYLRATDLEIGLLLHFGPSPAFYRVAVLNTRAKPPHPG